MLAVSGLLKEYRSLKNATERREKCWKYLEEHYGEKRDPDSIRRDDETKILAYIATELQKAKEDGEILKLVEQWTSITDKTQEKRKAFQDTIQDVIRAAESSSDKNIFIIIQGDVYDNNINFGNVDEARQDKDTRQDEDVSYTSLAINIPDFSFTWGPARPTFMLGIPPRYPVFNSITNNPVLGDERSFVRIVDKTTGGKYLSNIRLEAGRDYEVFIGYHNNADSNLNDKTHGRQGVSWNVRLATNFPQRLSVGEQGQVIAKITADNTEPLSVWSGAHVTAKENVTLHYVNASARIYNGWAANGSILSTSLFSDTGTFLGMDKLNGMIYGGRNFSGYVLYTIRTIGVIDK